MTHEKEFRREDGTVYKIEATLDTHRNSFIYIILVYMRKKRARKFVCIGNAKTRYMSIDERSRVLRKEHLEHVTMDEIHTTIRELTQKLAELSSDVIYHRAQWL